MKNNYSMNKILQELSKMQVPQAWLGYNQPFELDCIDIVNSINFRVLSNFHKKYKIVWIYEFILSKFHSWSWRIVLDETIRLLGEKGKLVLRTIETSEITIPAIKNYLGRMFDIDCSVFCEHKYENGIWVVVFDIKRMNLEKYSSKTWTFAILTNGQKIDNVVNFLKSVRKFDKGCQHQIIVSGNRNSAYDEYNVEYLDLSPFRDDEYAEISKKKNYIAAISKNDNLMILHDRFVLNDNFFDGFEKYGYDFSFATIKQFYSDKTIYPFYCALPCDTGLLWRNPIQVDNYNLLYPAAYLNGGLLIFKTHIIQQIKFNSLLMWNQQEDCEITKVFREHSIVPRVNLFSSATTNVGKEKTSVFNAEDLDVTCYTHWKYKPSNFPDSLKEDAESICCSKMRIMIRKFSKLLPKSIKEGNAYKNIRERILNGNWKGK